MKIRAFLLLLFSFICLKEPALANQATEVGRLEIVPPPNQAGHRVTAAIKREGHTLAHGETTVPEHGTVTLTLHEQNVTTVIPAGNYDLWVVIHRDGLTALHPSFGDVFIRQTWNISATPSALSLTNASAWKEKSASNPANVLTIHYHRFDEDYTDVGIWTWDGYYKRTPEENEVYPVGEDDFGLIFQLDRAEYGIAGKSDKIGMVPRLHASWDLKDGDDKYWRPEMGNEIWLIGTKNQIWTKRPDISPQVAAAFIDAPNRLVVQLSRLLDETNVAASNFTILDDQNNAQRPAAARLGVTAGKSKSNFVELTTTNLLDVARRRYSVSAKDFAGNALAVPRGILDDATLFCDTNAVLGATYTPKATTFRVFAPTARTLKVVLYEDAASNRGRNVHPMRPEANGIWEITIVGDLAGKFYMLEIEDESSKREVLDIYSVNNVDSGRRARITDLARTNPHDWESTNLGPAITSALDMVIYEMHVRDFTIATNSPAHPQNRGKYLGFVEAADHLKQLGITHVQLMPVQDFENDETSTNYNWGYVTTTYFSPEGWFASNPNDDSRIREFKQLIAALHSRGIGVIMDVVYNHTASSAPFNQLVPLYYYRHTADGALSNGSGCGNDFRTEAPMARKYVVDSLKFWVREYGVDGFRFDLMALLDLETMKQAERELRAINPRIVLYGEPWGGGGNSPLRTPTNKQTIRGTEIGAFNDNFRDALIGSPFNKAEGGFIQNGSKREQVKRGLAGSYRDWADKPAQAINYISCHDNYVAYDKLKLSKPGATDAELKDIMKLAYLLLFTAQGVPFLHGGEEFARTKSGHDNSYNAPDSVNQVDWSQKERNADLLNYTRELIALRKAHPAFRLRAKEQIAAWLNFIQTDDPNALMYTLDASGVPEEPWKKICVIANASDAMSVPAELPPGAWRVAFDHNGRADDRQVEGILRVRYKSGMILYQQ